MAEANPIFALFLLILTIMAIYWVLVGQRKRNEMLLSELKDDLKNKKNVKRERNTNSKEKNKTSKKKE